MGLVEQSDSAIESQLSVLEESYDSFAVNQRTVAVPSEQYERVRERPAREVELRARIENDSAELLHVDHEDGEVLPSTVTTVDDHLEGALRSEVETTTGISCRLEELSAVTILGFRDAELEERDTIYRLILVYDGVSDGGSIEQPAEWRRNDSTADSLLV